MPSEGGITVLSQKRGFDGGKTCFWVDSHAALRTHHNWVLCANLPALTEVTYARALEVSPNVGLK